VNTLVDVASMTGLATLSVGLWTLRVAVTARGFRTAAAIIAAVEAIIFVLAFSRVIDGLTAPGRIAAYGAGVGVGTLLGLTIDRRLSRGYAGVDVVVPAQDAHVVGALHQRGWPTTSARGEGLSGAVILASVTVDESRLADLLDDLARIAPDAFWTARRVDVARAVPVPVGFVQITRRRTAGTPRRDRNLTTSRRPASSIRSAEGDLLAPAK
jgi:uncharacterized protein YebE (UPF0316 family)